MEILIAEDDKITQELLSSILKNHGNVIVVDDGNKAIKLFNEKLKRGENYDLICLDIMMPDLDGISTLKEIRNIETDNNVDHIKQAKVLMITALDDQSIMFESYMVGTTGYIVKPIIKQSVDDELRKLGLI